MRSFQDMPIRRKLTLVIMLTSSLGLLLAGAIIIAYEWGSYRHRMSQDLSTLAQVIGDQETAALVFNDPDTARQTLAALKGRRTIRIAALYNADGKLFASYVRSGLGNAELPAKPSATGHRFQDGYLEVFQSLRQDGDAVGTVYLQEGLEEMQSQLANYAGIVVLVVIGSMLATLAVSAGLQRAITDPIMRLAGVARTVSEEGDFSVRVPNAGGDELGRLIATFNQMLTRIEETDLALRNSNASLQEEIGERMRSEEWLRVSEANFQALLDNTIVGIYIIQDDRFLVINPRLAEIYGYTLDEMLALGPTMDMVIEEDRARVEENFRRRVVGEAGDSSYAFRARRKDGRIISIEGHASHANISGRPARIGLLLDVTERKRAEEELRRLLTNARCILWRAWVMAETVPSSENGGSHKAYSWHFMVPDEQAAQRVLPLEQPEGCDYMWAWHRSRLEADNDRINATAEQALVEGAPEYSQEFRCINKAGDLRWLHEDVTVKVVGPDRWDVFGVSTDITETKRTAEKLEEYVQKLEISNRDLQDFAYVSSHDLQEPLRAIQNYSERLRTKHGDSLDEQGLEYLQRMQNAAGRMRVLIHDLLAYSRVTTKAKDFVETDLNAVARTVLADLAVRIEDTGGVVELGDLPIVQAEPTQMRQLLQNFIGNALKFHRPGEPPVVKVYSTSIKNETTARTVCFTVEDNGIGFDEKYRDKIFVPFQRLHGQGKYEGTGIGLAICRKIVERHGGTIDTCTTPGEGASFTVTLPRFQE